MSRKPDIAKQSRRTFATLSRRGPAALLMALCTLSAAPQQTQLEADTLQLSEVEAVARRRATPLTDGAGAMSVSVDALGSGVRGFGEADILRYVGMLPGVNSISDYASGSAIDGSDYSQNLYRLERVPVIFPYHFGGIFSTFNPRLFPRATLRKTIHPASDPAVMGGVVDVKSSPVRAERLQGELNVGLTASSLALKTPLSPQVEIGVGARISYITLLYGDLLGGRSTDVDYDFADADLTLDWHPDTKNTVALAAHYNNDRLTYADRNFNMLTRLRWANTAASMTWKHRGDALTHEHTLSYSRLDTRLGLDLSTVALALLSGSDEASLTGRIDLGQRGPIDVEVGYEASTLSFVPQSGWLGGYAADIDNRTKRERSGMGRLWGEIHSDFAHSLRLTAGLTTACYGSGGYTSLDADPRLSLTFSPERWHFTLHVGSYHQYFHYVGLAEIGLASNFRLPATEALPRQGGWNFAAMATCDFGAADEWSVSADAYAKTVRGQAEYLGNVLDMVDNDYRAIDYTCGADGWNSGVNLMFRRNVQPVSGWLSYGYNVARRHWKDSRNWFTASSDIRHALTANLTWEIGRHWSVNAVFNLSSGRPYTPVKRIYIIGERLIREYGERNSARMPLYHRLDLGATYSLRQGRFLHRINVSLLNAYAHDNVEMQTYAFNTETGRYYLRRIKSLYRLMPSISYTLSL